MYILENHPGELLQTLSQLISGIYLFSLVPLFYCNTDKLRIALNYLFKILQRVILETENLLADHIGLNIILLM